jgi:heterodisulfide reductase subunit C
MVKEISKADKIEAGNLMEEASEIFDACIQCGMCKGICGVFRVLREEQYSPRGKRDLLNEKIMDKILFKCNMCRACGESCPLNLKVCDAVLKAREAMVLLGKGLKGNEEMIKNIRRLGNPFGEMSDKDKEKLYCC